MRVMVCGSRGWRDYRAVVGRLRSLPANAIVMEGGADGADVLAACAARELGRRHERFPPDPRVASPQRYHDRNDAMLALADLVLAFWDGESPGTRSVIAKAKERGIPLEVVAPPARPAGNTR